jgi:hypothetical protein
MGVLEKVMDLKGRGISENEIISRLREEGISPGAIMDALNQARIKAAVSSGENTESGMQPSILTPEGFEEEPRELPTQGEVPEEALTPPTPSPYYRYPLQKEVGMHEIPGEEYIPRPQGEFYPEEQLQYQAQYQPEYVPQEYPQQEYRYPVSGISDTDTIIEIAEQVFFEKIKTIQKQVEDLNEFRVLAQTKIDNISDRLKRIELNIDRLQAEILEKVGSYGRGLEGIKKEMGMVQESFGKIVNIAADKTEEKHKHHIPVTYTSHHKAPARKKTTSRKKKR